MTERIKVPAGSEVLSDIMETLRFRSTIFFRSRLAAPWGFSLEEETAPRFHISCKGGFFVGDGEDHAPVEVGETGIILVPDGRPHWIADRPGRPLVPSAKAGEACELKSPFFQTGTITNLLICGITRFDSQLSHPLVTSLPSLIHFPRFDRESPIWRLVELIDAEAERSQALRTPILSRLTEALYLQMLQEVVEHGEGASGFFGALRDCRVRRALELLHREPITPWTLHDLANQAALSRATLVRRFRESVGVAPIEYLTRWRLLKAQQLVRHSDDSMDRIAGRVGFSSAQTLTKAFKRHFGVTPSSLRR